jgi:hypothetical protein
MFCQQINRPITQRHSRIIFLLRKDGHRQLNIIPVNCFLWGGLLDLRTIRRKGERNDDWNGDNRGELSNSLDNVGGMGHLLQDLRDFAVGEHIQKRRLAQGNVERCLERVVENRVTRLVFEVGERFCFSYTSRSRFPYNPTPVRRK